MTDAYAVGREYDYIVVGAGTAGCVLAARFSEDPTARVLPVEAGTRDPATATLLPRGAHCLTPTSIGTEPGSMDSVALPGHPTRMRLGQLVQHQWAQLPARSPLWGYDAWRADGTAGWGYDDLLPYFRRPERAPGRDPAVRSVNGPLFVSPPSDPNPLVKTMVAAATEAGFAQPAQRRSRERVRLAWQQYDDRARHNAADVYLNLYWIDRI
jgi:choline dehydrogenase